MVARRVGPQWLGRKNTRRTQEEGLDGQRRGGAK